MSDPEPVRAPLEEVARLPRHHHDRVPQRARRVADAVAGERFAPDRRSHDARVVTTLGWTIVAVPDEAPDGPIGRACTVGLSLWGCPELFLLARPAHGAGLDGLVLSPEAMSVVLDAVGSCVRAGTLAAGSVAHVDAGHGRLQLVLDLVGPIRADDVAARRLPAAQRVLDCRLRRRDRARAVEPGLLRTIGDLAAERSHHAGGDPVVGRAASPRRAAA